MRLQQPALLVTFSIAVVASVFAIWPVVTDAPWEDAEGGFRRTEAEVIASVRAEVGPLSCGQFARAWAAEYQGGGVWYVGTTCGMDVRSLGPPDIFTPAWSFREASERIIPLNSLARSLR